MTGRTEPEDVDVYEAKTQLSMLLNRVANGDEVIIGRSGKPVARLVPYATPKQRRRFGRLAGNTRMTEDFAITPAWPLDAFEGVDDDNAVGESIDSG